VTTHAKFVQYAFDACLLGCGKEDDSLNCVFGIAGRLIDWNLLLEVALQCCILGQFHLNQRLVGRTTRNFVVHWSPPIIGLSADIGGRTVPDEAIQDLKVALSLWIGTSLW